MISLKKRNQGFTIVELLIVIVVISILALLVITTYSGIQAKARNSKRSSDVATIQTQLEAFFQDNGYYPSDADMNSSSWVKTNMKSLDQGALVDPSMANTSDCVTKHDSCFTNDKAGAKQYFYHAEDSSGAACATDTSCAQYTLTATYEGTVNGADNVTKTNLD
ncbi:MAG TPA: prepilin-type N-terminal cleavage/methylation domain-containing protein [Candidatus Saccharimonadales bacterium]|nr:prepilin-type N-terminal cleavage/methylation domain-containing protein [Candidatus Saccharimonadales bacterium]